LDTEWFNPEIHRTSKEDRDSLTGEIGRTIVELQSVTHDVDDAVAARLGINHTDSGSVGAFPAGLDGDSSLEPEA
jgi:hypothetical protein